MHTTRFGINFICYALSQKIRKPNDIKVFSSKKTKGSKLDSQNQLMLHMLKGE